MAHNGLPRFATRQCGVPFDRIVAVRVHTPVRCARRCRGVCLDRNEGIPADASSVGRADEQSSGRRFDPGASTLDSSEGEHRFSYRLTRVRIPLRKTAFHAVMSAARSASSTDCTPRAAGRGKAAQAAAPDTRHNASHAGTRPAPPTVRCTTAACRSTRRRACPTHRTLARARRVFAWRRVGWVRSISSVPQERSGFCRAELARLKRVMSRQPWRLQPSKLGSTRLCEVGGSRLEENSARACGSLQRDLRSKEKV